jgi:S1-C subfamily serine protease
MHAAGSMHARRASLARVPLVRITQGTPAALLSEGLHLAHLRLQVMPGGPAYLSGAVHVGSLITAIDGAKVTSHFISDEISEMIRGSEGTRLSLEVLPPDSAGRHDRAKIQFVDLVLSPSPSPPTCVGALFARWLRRVRVVPARSWH